MVKKRKGQRKAVPELRCLLKMVSNTGGFQSKLTDPFDTQTVDC